jgi:hypothetical protein
MAVYEFISLFSGNFKIIQAMPSFISSFCDCCKGFTETWEEGGDGLI